jgi:hypothetical protein
MTVCFRKRSPFAQVLRGFYLQRRAASAGEIQGDGRRPIMAIFDHGAHPRTVSRARLCPAKWDQPQQLRKTSLLKYA